MKAIIFIFFILPTITFASDMKLIGKGLLEYSIFNIDIYEVSYYKGPKGSEKIILEYKTNVKKKYTQQGWKVGLKHLTSKNTIYKQKSKWIIENSIDLSKGDKFTIKKEKNKVSFIRNEKLIASINDKIVARLIFEPWLGGRPIDKDLKKKLLGG